MMIRRIVGQILQECGFQVVLAENGRKGLETAKSTQPDLILMDIEMPLMNGIEATSQLKKDPATSHIPVLIFTSLGSEEDIQRSLAAGCQGFLNKPISKKELETSINDILGRQD